MVSRYGSAELAETALSVGIDNSASAGFPASGSVVTSLAGFAAHRPQPPGGRTAIPAALRYPLAVSRRTPVAASIRRSAHPSRPNATTCSLFSMLKTLLMPTEPVEAFRRCQCPGPSHLRWPVLGDRRGHERMVIANMIHQIFRQVVGV